MERPTLTDFDHKSAYSIGAESLLLSKKELEESCGDNCAIIVGVYGSESSQYSLTLTRGITLLTEGTVYPGQTSDWGSYTYYRYYNPCSECHVEIAANPISKKRMGVVVNHGTTLPLRQDA